MGREWVRTTPRGQRREIRLLRGDEWPRARATSSWSIRGCRTPGAFRAGDPELLGGSSRPAPSSSGCLPDGPSPSRRSMRSCPQVVAEALSAPHARASKVAARRCRRQPPGASKPNGTKAGAGVVRGPSTRMGLHADERRRREHDGNGRGLRIELSVSSAAVHVRQLHVEHDGVRLAALERLRAALLPLRRPRSCSSEASA